ncbi:hypothetical protein WA158_004971 [Blastocystis sp. Blastoise]
MSEKAKEPIAEVPVATEEVQPVTINHSVCDCEFPYGYKFERSRVLIRDILITNKGLSLVGKNVTIGGWTRTQRLQGGGAFCFINLNDGSCFESIQIIVDKDKVSNFEEVIKSGSVSVSMMVKGVLVKSPAAGQAVELHATEVTILGTCDSKTYPLAKKRHTLEYLRDIAHLRIGAVARIRNACAFATHLFFQQRGFKYVHTPLITTADCEGAGEMFTVTTLLNDKDAKLPTTKDGKIDYTKDFFGRHAKLTVSGQLNVETYCTALCDVYTFGPTFRAEDSHTSRHLSEFWMIEPEMAFADLNVDMAVAEDYVKFCTTYCLEHNTDDIAFFEKNGLTERLHNVLESPFAHVTYHEAVDLVIEASKEHPFEMKPYQGMDMASEHERYLTEVIFKKPVYIYLIIIIILYLLYLYLLLHNIYLFKYFKIISYICVLYISICYCN